MDILFRTNILYFVSPPYLLRQKDMKNNLYWKLLQSTFSAWVNNKASRLGAALAFYSILSLGPMILLVLVVAASIWGEKAAQGQIVAQMSSLVGQQGAQAIQTILKTASHSRHGGMIAAGFSFLTLLFSASGVFGELQGAMNTIWKVPPRKEKGLLIMLRQRFLSFTMVVGSAFLLLISLVLSAAFSAITSYASGMLPALSVIMPTLDFVVSLALITLLFALTFKTVPDTKITWGSVWPAAVLTAVLFVVGKMLIGLYLSHTGVASSYGAAGSVVIILIWVYYSAQILFFGAEFAYVWGEHCKRRIQ
jgi:membrane protein